MGTVRDGTLGIDVTLLDDTPRFQLGQQEWVDGTQYVYVKATGTRVQYNVSIIDSSFNLLAGIATATIQPTMLGVPQITGFVDGKYGWVAREGAITINVIANCAANVRLNTTSTAGSLDDDNTNGAGIVGGLYLLSARGGTDGSASAFASMPLALSPVKVVAGL